MIIIQPRLLNKWFKSAWIRIDVKILYGWSLINLGAKNKISFLKKLVKSVKIKAKIKNEALIIYCQSYLFIELLECINIFIVHEKFSYQMKILAIVHLKMSWI